MGGSSGYLSFSQFLVPKAGVGTQHPLPTPSPISSLPWAFKCSGKYPYPMPQDPLLRAVCSSVGTKKGGRGTGYSAAPAGPAPDVQNGSRSDVQARGLAAGGTEVMAEPGPHPASQPNTPPRHGRPWLLARGFLSGFLKTFRGWRSGRVFSPSPQLRARP